MNHVCKVSRIVSSRIPGTTVQARGQVVVHQVKRLCWSIHKGPTCSMRESLTHQGNTVVMEFSFRLVLQIHSLTSKIVDADCLSNKERI